MNKLIDPLRQIPNPQHPAHLHTGEGEIDIDILTEIKQRLVAANEHRFIELEYFHCDHLGTPIALSDLKGNVIWQAEYDPWGNIIKEYNPDNIEQTIRFQGQQYDEESGLHYNRHRYYDPHTGAYITQDPIGLLGGINPYAYVTDPIGWIDPLGLSGTPKKRPPFADINAHYPKNSSGDDLYGPDVYKMVGGEIYKLQQLHGYENACALRVSVALNKAGEDIPDVPGTFKGAGGKNYFLSAAKLESYLTSTYGSPTEYTKNFASQLQGQKEIYIMRPNYPGKFGASGHATLYNGADCIGGHCYFNATGGTHKVSIWNLP